MVSGVLYLANCCAEVKSANFDHLTPPRPLQHSTCTLVQRGKPYSNNPSGLVSRMLTALKCYNDMMLNNDNHQVSSTRLLVNSSEAG